MCRLRAQRAQLIAVVALLACGSAAAQQPAADANAARAPINNWSELRTALAGCWTPPAGTAGSLIGFRFGLSKTGEIRGKPLVTARDFRGSEDDRRHFSDSAYDALKACFPIPVTASFGAILGESLIRLRFVNTKPEVAYQINSNITVFAPP